MDRPDDTQPHVLVVGGGFGGLAVTRALATAPVSITLVDRNNHHLFQPLLYQVAMAGVSPADIAAPIRSMVRQQRNVAVRLDRVLGVDLAAGRATLHEGGTLSYDYLVLALGVHTSYFGHAQWAEHALGLKDLDDAIEIRRRVLMAFEAAEVEQDAARRQALLTFVVIGGGPTGVELAGAIGELARFVLARDFRHIDPRATRVLLVEGGPRILGGFAPELARSAAQQLQALGVDLRTQTRVLDVDAHGVQTTAGRLDAATVLWAAGICGTPLSRSLGVPLDRLQRVIVEPDCSIPGHPNAFAIGDMMALEQDGAELPGVAQVALQQGRFVARRIAAVVDGDLTSESFRYRDRGSMATIGRSRAVAQIGWLRLRGMLAWMAWLFIHLIFLIGFRNRAAVLLNWVWSYVTYQRGARLITRYGRDPRDLKETV